MGIWDYMNSGKEYVKRYTPDPVKGACKISYDYSATAVRNIDDAVRVNGLQKLSQYMPDEEARAKMVNFGYKFVKNASVYGFKEATNIFIPGGKVVTEIYSKTVHEIEVESRKNQDKSRIKEVIDNSSKNTTGNGALKLLESKEVQLGSENKVRIDSFAHQTPEDVIRVFMMKEFMGTRFPDNLLVPGHGKRKKV